MGIGDQITSFTMTTDSQDAGESSHILAITITWNDKQYTCSLTPNRTNTTYSCNHNTLLATTITPYTDNPYYIKLEWQYQDDPLQISMINITDNTGIYYAIDRFCIRLVFIFTQKKALFSQNLNNLHLKIYTAPIMQCTLDKLISDQNSGSFCNQWSSKHKYNKLAIGGDTEFELLYIDYKIFGDRFANQLLEGSVRPPNIEKVGFTTGAAEDFSLSIQWDLTLYNPLSVSPSNDDTFYEYSLNTVKSVFCPGIQSDFWISLYFPVGFYASITSIATQDETGRTYEFHEFCQKDGQWTALGNPTTNCTSKGYPGYWETTEIFFGTFQVNPLVPMFLPECMFDYPDDNGTNAEVVIALNGTGMYYPCTFRNML